MTDILRPLDEVHIHGQVTLLAPQYDIIMTEVARGTSRSKNSRQIFHFLVVHPVEQGVNTTHLDVKRSPLRRREDAGHRLLEVNLAQEWFPSIRSERVPPRAQSEKDSPRIGAILKVLEEQCPPTELTCHVDWFFRDDEADPIISIPFPISVPSDLTMRNVKGLRLSNEDESQVASLERLPDGNLFVNLTFTLSGAIIGENTIGTTKEMAETIIQGLVRPHLAEGRWQG